MVCISHNIDCEIQIGALVTDIMVRNNYSLKDVLLNITCISEFDYDSSNTFKN